ncbi:MAG: cupin domain-containing protein [Candidatus Limnocylindria bacterium]
MVTGPKAFVVRPGEGEILSFPGFGVQFKVPSEITGGQLSIIELPLKPRRLVPPHTHLSEDELSYVLEGEIGFRVGDDTLTAGPGTYVYKPKGLLHTFWNASDRLARVLEIIFPGGFEDSFRPGAPPQPGRRANIHDDTWVPELKERYKLKLLGEP